ncbi:hypothetical protein BH23ACT9_BH23ACT9_14560 [soil metagenome]
MAADRYRMAEEEERIAALLEDTTDLPGPAAARVVVLNQIADDTEPHTSATARRLLDGGLAPAQVLTQLSLAVLQQIKAAVEGRRRRGGHGRCGAARPCRRPPGAHPEDTPARTLLERCEEDLTVEFGPLVSLEGDRTASLQALARDRVLTLVLTSAGRDADLLHVGLDLTLFAWSLEPTWNGQPLEPVDTDGEGLVWYGPPGWLGSWDAGTVLAVRMDATEQVTIEALPSPPAVDAALLDAVTAAYHQELGEADLPVWAAELAARLCLEDPSAFTDPQAPLTELCEAAGLDIRGAQLADDLIMWRSQRRIRHITTILAMTDDEELSNTAVRVLDGWDDLADGRPVDPEAVTWLLNELADLDVLALVEPGLVDDEQEEGRGPAAAAQALLDAARRRHHVAVARYLAALLAEQVDDLAAAEQHLELVYEARPDFPPSTERLAWYASDHGDAVRAVRLLRRLRGHASRGSLLDTLEPFTRGGAATLSRNDPCWCGSGRKYKRCHLGVPAHPALPDRVGWLCRKGVAYLEHTDRFAHLVAHVARARTGPDGGGDWEAALRDALVMDLMLTEGEGWVAFLSDRGSLLPDDEALLAASWLTLPRTVYEVTAVRAGEGPRPADWRCRPGA